MTKFKVGSVETLESITACSKKIKIEQDGNWMVDVTIYHANLTDLKELSNKLESAIRRALK